MADALDAVCVAVEEMVAIDRDSDQRLFVNTGLRLMEEALVLRLRAANESEAIIIASVSAFRTEVAMELLKTMASVAQKFHVSK